MTPATISAPARPRVFISYAQSDRDRASQLAELLQLRGVATQQFDQPKAGESIAAAVAEAIRASDTVIVLVSKAAALSAWVNREIAFALSADAGDQPKLVIPVIVESGVELPPFLRDLGHVDLTRASDPGEAADQLVTATTSRRGDAKDRAREWQLRRRMLAAERAAIMEAEKQMYEEYSRRSARLLRRLVVLSLVVAAIIGITFIKSGIQSGPLIVGIGAALLGLTLGATVGYRKAWKR